MTAAPATLVRARRIRIRRGSPPGPACVVIRILPLSNEPLSCAVALETFRNLSVKRYEKRNQANERSDGRSPGGGRGEAADVSDGRYSGGGQHLGLDHS